MAEPRVVNLEELQRILATKPVSPEQVEAVIDLRQFFGDAVSFDFSNIVLYAIDQGKLERVLSQLRQIQQDHHTVHPDAIPHHRVIMAKLFQIWTGDLGFLAL